MIGLSAPAAGSRYANTREKEGNGERQDEPDDNPENRLVAIAVNAETSRSQVAHVGGIAASAFIQAAKEAGGFASASLYSFFALRFSFFTIALCAFASSR